MRVTIVPLLLFSFLMFARNSEAQHASKTQMAITAADVMERETILASDSLEGRRTGQPGAEKARRYIENQFNYSQLHPLFRDPGQIADYSQEFSFSEHALDTTKHERTIGYNVVAYLPGSNTHPFNPEKDEVIVIGAHYDHLGYGGPFALDSVHSIHYGADDNASGVTGLLEIAEDLSEHHIRPKRSIVFIAFSGEEEGLFGSDYFVNHSPIPLDSIQAMLNMDMIGRLNDSNTLIVQGIGTSPVFRSVVDSANNGDLKLKYFQTGTGPSDHASFYKKNIPVLFFFTGFHEDYHKATDTKEKINAQGEVKVAKYVERILLDLANRPDKIPFTRVAGDTEQKAQSFGVYVGGVPDYGYDGDGVRISEVRDNSPALKYGLQKGDVIIGFDEMKIKTIYDYTNALAKHHPNDRVVIKVQRGTSLVDVPVVLGTRSAPH